MLLRMVTTGGEEEETSVFSSTLCASPVDFDGEASWSAKDYIAAHRAVRASGKHNFEACRIPIPTHIRYDRIREALGSEITPREHQVLELLKFGMPIDCQGRFGVRSVQKNHHSAIKFKNAIDVYLSDNCLSKAILGPFEESPIPDLSFSPH